MIDDSLPRDHRLCYHTSRLDYLVSALQDGIWPRYCPEDYSRIFGAHIGDQFWLAVPMICFTDMLPDTNSAHRSRYGDYTIAIAKDAASQFDINPLVYVVVDGYVARWLVNCIRPGRTGRLDQSSPVWPLLPFIKATPGAQLSRGQGGRSASWEIIPMEDELEWRYVPADPGLKIVENVRESKDIPRHLMDLSEKHRLKVPDDLITNIIVPSKADAAEVKARFPALAGKVSVRGKSRIKRLLAWLYTQLP